MRTAKEITASINQVKVAGAKLDDKIQSIGLEILAHVEEHKEASLAVKLYNALPKGSRRNALVAWFLEFGAIAVNTAKDKDVMPLKFKRDTATQLEAAAKTPWYEFKKERAPSEEFDFDKALAALIKKAQKAQAEGHLVAANDDKLVAVLKLA